MVDKGTYEFKNLNAGRISPEESFTNDYAEEVYELEHVRTATKTFNVILDAKYEKADSHKFMETQCQYLTEKLRNELLKLLKKLKSFLVENLVPGKQIQ